MAAVYYTPPADKAGLILWGNQPATAVIEALPPSVGMQKDSAAPGTHSPPATVQPMQKQAADTPRTLSFEQVAGNISKETFEKKALQKTNQLNIYLKIICGKAADYEEINKAIDQSVCLFVDENAMIETSSINRNHIKRQKIRDYLSHIKLIKYDKIEIEWTNVQYVSDVKNTFSGQH